MGRWRKSKVGSAGPPATPPPAPLRREDRFGRPCATLPPQARSDHFTWHVRAETREGRALSDYVPVAMRIKQVAPNEIRISNIDEVELEVAPYSGPIVTQLYNESGEVMRQEEHLGPVDRIIFHREG